MENLLSPLEQPFWEKYTAGLITFDQFTLRPWDPSCPPAENLRYELKKALDKFALPQRPTEPSGPYDLETVKHLLGEARRIYNDKSNLQRHWQSLNLTYDALWCILSEEPLVRLENRLDENSREKLKRLANGFVRWDKNSAWLGVSSREPLSTLRTTANRMWIYRYGLSDEKTAVQIVSTLAYVLMGTGRLSGALESLRCALEYPGIDEAAKRDLMGAMAGLLGRLREPTIALEKHHELEALITKYFSDAPDAHAHRKGSIVLSRLKAGNKRAEAEIKDVLEALTKTRHIGFHLQFLEGLADYYINEKRDSDAESVVSDALKLLETNQESYHNHRKRFEELRDLLDARRHLRTFIGAPMQRYSCFISYSHQDEAFAKRLHDALQSKEVECWYAPEDIKGGKKLYEQIQEAIWGHDKLLIVLSAHSMQSEWVKTEVANARRREVTQKRQILLFPIQQFPPCPKDPIRPMPEGSPGASFGSQKPCVTLPSKREAKRGAIPCNVGFPFG